MPPGGDSTLDIRYDGTQWAVSVRHGKRQQVGGAGETLEIALGVVEEKLDLERWTG